MVAVPLAFTLEGALPDVFTAGLGPTPCVPELGVPYSHQERQNLGRCWSLAPTPPDTQRDCERGDQVSLHNCLLGC
jgi:hypothetical protein